MNAMFDVDNLVEIALLTLITILIIQQYRIILLYKDLI